MKNTAQTGPEEAREEASVIVTPHPAVPSGVLSRQLLMMATHTITLQQPFASITPFISEARSRV